MRVIWDLDVRVRFTDELPEDIRGFLRYSEQFDKYTIFISSKLSGSDRAKVFEHEILHILRGDLWNDRDIDQIDSVAHSA